MTNCKWKSRLIFFIFGSIISGHLVWFSARKSKSSFVIKSKTITYFQTKPEQKRPYFLDSKLSGLYQERFTNFLDFCVEGYQIIWQCHLIFISKASSVLTLTSAQAGAEHVLDHIRLIVVCCVFIYYFSRQVLILKAWELFSCNPWPVISSILPAMANGFRVCGKSELTLDHTEVMSNLQRELTKY